MTDPVDTGALRVLAADCNENNYDASNGFLLGSAGDALDVAADEVDRLRAVIENAPHEGPSEGDDGYGCEVGYRVGAYCTCWKADAL